MKVSVALCTCNGEKFIASQLRSILGQGRRVDEVIVCDDASRDATVDVASRLLEEAHADYRVEVHRPALGVGGNFDRAIHLATGDLIFLSDQDDVWLPQKVETVVRWFEEHPDRQVVFTDGYFMDDDGQPFTQRTLFDAVTFTHRTRRYFDRGFQLEAFLSHNRATGATMAFRRSFVSAFTIDPAATTASGRPLHDQVIAMAAASYGQLGYIATPLIHYRIHHGQECGFGQWINHPPHSSDLVRPLVPADELVGSLPAEARARACFGRQRRRYRGIHHKWRVLAHAAEYRQHYGAAWRLPLLRDLCWLWL